MSSVKRVFISHATENTAFAERLATALRSAGLDVWLDASHMGPGNFVDRISSAINACDVLILALSPSALASQWVPEEMNAAMVRYKQGFMRAPIVVVAEPVSLRDIPALWTAYNRIDATTNYSQALQQLVTALGIAPVGQATTPVAAPRPSLPSLVGFSPGMSKPSRQAADSQQKRPPDTHRRRFGWALRGARSAVTLVPVLRRHWKATAIALLLVSVVGFAAMRLLLTDTRFQTSDAVMAVVCEAFSTHSYDALIARIDPT